MSIQITLLGHAPKKKDGYSSGGSGSDGGTNGFLHLAWANTEDGEGFTKDNHDSSGHIVFYPFLGMTFDDNIDDEELSFNSYDWMMIGQGGTTCKCYSCCNYIKCNDNPDDPSTGPVDPSTGPVDPSTGPVDPSTGPVEPELDPYWPGLPASYDTIEGIKITTEGECFNHNSDILARVGSDTLYWMKLSNEDIEFDRSTRLWELNFLCHTTYIWWWKKTTQEGDIYFADFAWGDADGGAPTNDLTLQSVGMRKIDMSQDADYGTINVQPYTNYYIVKGQLDPWIVTTPSGLPRMYGDRSPYGDNYYVEGELYSRTSSTDFYDFNNYASKLYGMPKTYYNSIENETYTYRWKSDTRSGLANIIPRWVYIRYGDGSNYCRRHVMFYPYGAFLEPLVG